MFLLELEPEEITLRPLSPLSAVFRRIADKEKINLHDSKCILIGNFIKMDLAKKNKLVVSNFTIVGILFQRRIK